MTKPKTYMRRLFNDIENNKSLSLLPAQSTEQRSHEDNFNSYLVHPDLDRGQLKQWLTKKLNILKTTEQEKGSSKQETANPHVKMRFHKVNPGRLDKVYGSKLNRPYQIDTPFEVMETAVTNRMWYNLMGRYPFRSENAAENPDHPVVNISWWIAVEFANRLSKLHGLKPVSDFSQMRGYEDSTRNGSVYIRDLANNMKKLRINAPGGDIYQAEGYRLPTEEEMQLMYFSFDNRGSVDEKLHQHSILDYAWLKDNSDDLYGNVQHWVNGFCWVDGRPYQPINPQMKFECAAGQAITHGASFKAGTKPSNYYGIVGSHESESESGLIGFRLVRSLPKEKKP